MRPEARRFIVPTTLLALTVFVWYDLGFDAAAFSRAGAALQRFLPEFWPPRTDILPAIGRGLAETLEMAFLSTLFGYALSLPLALLAARNLSPPWLAEPARLMASAVRVMPSILWAMLMVVIFGFGPLAGVVAMTFYSMGYLAKLQYEAFEGLDRGVLDALRAMGASPFQVAWHGVLPAAQNVLRSQGLFMFEYNVRSSAVVGVVGAGGIGVLLSQYLRQLDFQAVTTVLVILFVAVVIIDYASMRLRRRFTDYEGPRASWRTLLGAAPRGE